MGPDALYKNTTGKKNTASGSWSLNQNTTGTENTGTGSFSLYSNIDGVQNTASGNASLKKNTTGSYNTALGCEAGFENTTGSKNTILGNQAEASNEAAENQIVIGQGATGQADNSVTLGNSDVNSVYMGENSGATVYCGGLIINGNQVLGQQGSAVANVEGTAGDSSTDNSIIINNLRDQVNALLLVLRTHGIIAT